MSLVYDQGVLRDDRILHRNLTVKYLSLILSYLGTKGGYFDRSRIYACGHDFGYAVVELLAS